LSRRPTPIHTVIKAGGVDDEAPSDAGSVEEEAAALEEAAAEEADAAAAEGFVEAASLLGVDALAPPDVVTDSPASGTVDGSASSAREELKSRIFAACAAADRGFAASPSDREAIEGLLDEISFLSPIDDATRGVSDGTDDAPLRACWRLVYTSASDVSTLAANPISQLGGIYQDARELPVIVNVIDTFPRVLANLPPSVAATFATSSRIKVRTVARPRSASRVGLSFTGVGFEVTNVLGQKLPDWLPAPPMVDLPQLGLGVQRQIFQVPDDVDPRDAESNPSYFDIRYLDENFLVISQGSPGGMFAAVKVDDLAE